MAGGLNARNALVGRKGPSSRRLTSSMAGGSTARNALVGRKGRSSRHDRLHARAAANPLDGWSAARKEASRIAKGERPLFYTREQRAVMRDDKMNLLREAMQSGEVPDYLDGVPGNKISWQLIWYYLTALSQESVSLARAARLQAGGALLLDVRPLSLHSRARPAGAVHVPIFDDLDGSKGVGAKVLNAWFGLAFRRKATERNLRFVDELKSRGVSEDDQILVMCNRGGTLDTKRYVEGYPPFADPELTYGRESRSLKAVFELRRNGFTNVTHVLEGWNGTRNGWKSYTLEMGLRCEGTEYEPKRGDAPRNDRA